MFVLAIDTSSDAVVVGVASGGEVLAEQRRSAARAHGELLAPSIAGCLAEAGLRPADLGAVVAGVGPGPYTGLRVGLVTAAALGQALAIPTYGVCSLDPMGADLSRDNGDVLVVTDARRKEVYWARYDEHGQRLDGPHVNSPDDVDLTGVSLVGGAGVALYPGAWPDDLDQNAGLALRPHALVALALDRVRSGAESEPLAPLYLRRPDAVVPGAPKSVRQR